SGVVIRTAVEQIRLAGRATQGVKVINLREGDQIASVVAVPKTEEPELPAEGAEPVEGATAEGAVVEGAVESAEQAVEAPETQPEQNAEE
ncbi:MAG: hypothetical protein IIX78_04035, partial [Alistipes sp.]|nr:hypothetical protein [Alistipes sp.]